MYKFHSSQGIIGLSRFEDGRDLPPVFRPSSTVKEEFSRCEWTPEKWLADMVKDIVEEEKLTLQELLFHLQEIGFDKLATWSARKD
ncbi:hypothetical protein [Phaeobacter sp. HF9A]|uniref:hypothetical protein n=1 Tax=Phaeobacter sp. HF9A TaxID=2721561 RepID=UPI001C37A558|nr:hypothetical protein [Phaeobacter sp. HF9A]NIZ15702.1 hypothetical protein [Phaeobacter sp. HF9A]